MVTLFGEILTSNEREFLFSVAEKLGDAADLGIKGQVWLPQQGTYGLAKQTSGAAKGYFRVRLSFELADLVAKRCQPTDER